MSGGSTTGTPGSASDGRQARVCLGLHLAPPGRARVALCSALPARALFASSCSVPLHCRLNDDADVPFAAPWQSVPDLFLDDFLDNPARKQRGDADVETAWPNPVRIHTV